MLAGNEPEPRRHLATVLERCRIGDTSHHRTGSEGADTRNRCKPLARVILTMPADDLALQDYYTVMKIAQQIDQFSKQRLEQRGKCIIDDRFLTGGYYRMDPRSHCDSKLSEKPSDLISLSCSKPNQPFAGAMDRQNCLLIKSFNWDEAHGWTAYGLTDGFGIDCIVFVGLDVRLYILRGH